MDKKPEAKFRAANISATVWYNCKEVEGKEVEFYTVEFAKHERDNDGTWHTVKSFKPQEIPRLILVLTKAYEHIALRDQDEA